MGSLRLTLCTGILSAVVLTPAAYAADGGGVSVTPSSPVLGGDVALRVSGCTGRTATAVSEAFVADATLVGEEGRLSGESRIRSSLAPGRYDVRVTCGSARINGTFTVTGADAGDREDSGDQDDSGDQEVSDLPASPVAPVHAGGGGTANLAAEEARPAGPGTAQTVTGLVLAGIAAAAVGLRRARRGRDKD